MPAITIIRQVLQNGPRNYVVVLNAAWAANDTLAAYTAADPTSAGDMGVSIGGNTLYPGTHLRLWNVRYNLSAGSGATLSWDATSAQLFWQASGFGEQSFKEQGGIGPYSAGTLITGATGKILLNLWPSPTAAGTMTLELWCKKDIAQ